MKRRKVGDPPMDTYDKVGPDADGEDFHVPEALDDETRATPHTGGDNFGVVECSDNGICPSNTGVDSHDKTDLTSSLPPAPPSHSPRTAKYSDGYNTPPSFRVPMGHNIGSKNPIPPVPPLPRENKKRTERSQNLLTQLDIIRSQNLTTQPAPNGVEKQNIALRKAEEKVRSQAIKDHNDLSERSIQVIASATAVGIPVAASVDDFILRANELQPQSEFITGSYENNETYLTYFTRMGHVDAAHVLLKYGADPDRLNKKLISPIASASSKGNLETLRHLIDYGADVNLACGNGSSALIQASHFGNLGCVKLLVEHGANADFANNNGTTALMRASQEGYFEIAEILIKNGANVRNCNKEGMNALMLASQRGHVDLVTLLVKAGIDLNTGTHIGSSALILASKRGWKDCVKELVRMGAEIHLVDDRLLTAYDHAKKRSHMDVLPLLNIQVQIDLMGDSIRCMRNNMMMSIVLANRRGKVKLHPPYDYAHSLLEYLTSWRDSTSSSEDEPVLDLSQMRANMGPSLADCYPHLNETDLRSVEYKATMNILRALQHDDPTIPDSYERFRGTGTDKGAGTGTGAGMEFFEPSTLCIREDYETLRRHFGLHGLLPSESRALLNHGERMNQIYRVDHTLPNPCGAVRLRKPPMSRGNKWSVLWMRCLRRLPVDCLTIVISFLPPPRLWAWSLERAKHRISVAPGLVMHDLFIIVDEIFADSQLFTNYHASDSDKVPPFDRSEPRGHGGVPIRVIGAPERHEIEAPTGPADDLMFKEQKKFMEIVDAEDDRNADSTLDDAVSTLSIQESDAAKHKRESAAFRSKHQLKNMLVHIARAPHIQRFLVERCDMPIALVQSCVSWSATQMFCSEMNNSRAEVRDCKFDVQPTYVKSLLTFVKALHKWYLHSNCILSSLEMPARICRPIESAPQKYFAFDKIAVSRTQDPCYAHPTILINEGRGASVNYLTECSLLKSKVISKIGANDRLWKVNPGSAFSGTTAYQRGTLGISYADEYDSDDSENTENFLQPADADAGDTDDTQDPHEDALA